MQMLIFAFLIMFCFGASPSVSYCKKGKAPFVLSGCKVEDNFVSQTVEGDVAIALMQKSRLL